MLTTVTDNSPQSINTSLFSLDKEVQEVKKTTNEINNKLSDIDTESGVISVNGKQGIVELNASDVDALPSSTVIPTTTGELTNNSGFITINDVGASFVPLTRKVNDKQLNTDITLTASDVGALPDTTVIPTKTSELTNDSGFITSSDSITGNAATATRAGTADTATKAIQDGNGNVITSTYAKKSEVNTINGEISTVKSDINSVNSRIDSVNSEINNKLSSKANGNGNVFFRDITPRQMATIDEMKNIVRSYPIGSIILFATTWDEYTSFEYAGYNGYIIITGGSSYAYGLCRDYGDNGWRKIIRFIDNPEKCSGWLNI